MLSRRMAIISAAVFILVLLAALSFNARTKPPYSSPTALRTNEAYLRAHALETNFPVFDTNLFKSVAIEKTESGLTIKYQDGLEPPWHAFEGSVFSHKADSNGIIQLGDGSVQLSFIGVATGDPRDTPHHPFVRTPSKYFTPDLKPVDTNNPVLKLESYRSERWAQSLPSARFIFACSNLTEFVTRRFDAFDARTHHPLCGWNYSQRPFRDRIRFDVTLKLWHQTPIELLVTSAMGPTENYAMAVDEGAELKFPGGALKLLVIAEGRFEVLHGLGPGAPSNTVTLTKATITQGDPPNTSLIFYAWPRSGLMPWDLEFIDDTGKVHSAGHNDGSGPISVRTVDCPADRLKEIRVKRYPNLHTLSFTIPELPGLPEENRDLKNLFDVQVPYFELQHRVLLKQQLGDLVQMRVTNVALAPRPAGNPFVQKARTNSTARALFDELASSMPAHHTLAADSEKNEIRGRRHPLAGPINFIKAIFRIN